MRDDSNPTEIDAKGNKCWKVDGKLHREDGPAVISSYVEYYYKNGELHSYNDEPAINFKDGHQEWYKNGLLHRDSDLPAIVSHNGRKEWYQNGQLHRETDLPASINKKGDQKWYKHGLLHRDNDQAASITHKGSQKWYKNGKLHRDGGKPAFVGKTKTVWALNDEYHREDGPAVIWSDGGIEWWLHGKVSSEQEVNHYKLEQVLEINSEKLNRKLKL
jgi:antitoxin component YwqK of YwqJK toxin-antitoxin module